MVTAEQLKSKVEYWKKSLPSKVNQLAYDEVKGIRLTYELNKDIWRIEVGEPHTWESEIFQSAEDAAKAFNFLQKVI